MNRRNFIKDATAFAALGAVAPFANVSAKPLPAIPQQKAEIYSFSKLFQFLNYDELAAMFKESGIDGIDLTVRKGGHVEPENVETDLPKAVSAAQKHGITIPVIATDIIDPNDPLTIRILKTALDNGVKLYRFAPFPYDYKKSIPANLETFRTRMEQFGELNAKYNICGGYQHHSGSNFGGSPWELWEVIKNMDKRRIGCIYDVYHSVAEGLHSWPNAMRLMAPHTVMLYIKDFQISVIGKNARIIPCELGKGIVNFATFFKIRQDLNIDAPYSLHIEYALFTADEEKSLSHVEKYKKALVIMKRDTDTLKRMMQEV